MVRKWIYSIRLSSRFSNGFQIATDTSYFSCKICREARRILLGQVKSRRTLLITRSCRYRCGYRWSNLAARPVVKMASCTLTSNKWRDVSVRLYFVLDWQRGRYRYATTNYLSPRLQGLINAEIHYRHLTVQWATILI